MSLEKAVAEISRLPRPVLSEWAWQEQGVCRDLPTEMFFHPDGERGPRRANREKNAKAVCATCPVIEACRKHALAVQEPYGIWGGLSEDDRQVIIDRAARTSSPTSFTADLDGELFAEIIPLHLNTAS